jgi:hypothetical protein
MVKSLGKGTVGAESPDLSHASLRIGQNVRSMALPQASSGREFPPYFGHNSQPVLHSKFHPKPKDPLHSSHQWG